VIERVSLGKTGVYVPGKKPSNDGFLKEPHAGMKSMKVFFTSYSISFAFALKLSGLPTGVQGASAHSSSSSMEFIRLAGQEEITRSLKNASKDGFRRAGY